MFGLGPWLKTKTPTAAAADGPTASASAQGAPGGEPEELELPAVEEAILRGASLQAEDEKGANKADSQGEKRPREQWSVDCPEYPPWRDHDVEEEESNASEPLTEACWSVTSTGRPILRGRANLFAGAMYSGRSWLNTALPGRTLRLPLGIDDAIKVVRHLRQKTVVKGLVFKDDVTEYTVSIEIANHRRYPITADVRDQVPKPLFKKIEIKGFSCKTDGKTRSAAAPKKGHQRGWTKPDDDGRVIWFGRVGAGKVRKLSFTFRIVRPKDWILRQHGG